MPRALRRVRLLGRLGRRRPRGVSLVLGGFKEARLRRRIGELLDVNELSLNNANVAPFVRLLMQRFRSKIHAPETRWRGVPETLCAGRRARKQRGPFPFCQLRLRSAWFGFVIARRRDGGWNRPTWKRARPKSDETAIRDPTKPYFFPFAGNDPDFCRETSVTRTIPIRPNFSCVIYSQETS